VSRHAARPEPRLHGPSRSGLLGRRGFVTGALLAVVGLPAGAAALAATSGDDDGGGASAGAAAGGAASGTGAPSSSSAAGGSAPVVPDGLTGRAVQEAVDAVAQAGGGEVRLAAAEHLVQAPLVLRDGVTLVGSGSATVLRAGPDFLSTPGPEGGHPLLASAGARDVVVRDLVLDHSGHLLDARVPGRLDAHLLDLRHSTGVRVERVTTLNPFSYSIAVIGCQRFSVVGCRTSTSTSGRYDQLDGIHVLGSSRGTVADCDVDQGAGADGDDGLVAHSISEPCHDVVFSGNRVRGGRHGSAMQLAVGTAPVHDITVVRNTFYGSPRGVQARHWDGDGPLEFVTIGGAPEDGNTFSDNAGDAVDLRRVPGQRCVVTHNRALGRGGFFTREDPGNRVADNAETTTQTTAQTGGTP
jgi:hypothetical protein